MDAEEDEEALADEVEDEEAAPVLVPEAAAAEEPLAVPVDFAAEEAEVAAPTSVEHTLRLSV